MKRNNILNISMLILIVLGLSMIYLGFNSAAKILYPPILTGIGFILIAWVFSVLRESK